MSSAGIEVLGEADLAEEYDLFISVLGYESRSSFLARGGTIKAKAVVALAFPEEDYAEYLDNKRFLTNAHFSIVPKERAKGVLAGAVGQHIKHSRAAFSVLIDISSMSRPMLAELVHILSSIGGDAGVLASFVYLPAEFTKGSAEHPPVAVSEPVTPEYAGWTTAPERAITAVVGLGYEHDLALGALEFLEPTAAWAFIPGGEDRRYDDAVNEANRNLEAMLLEERSMRYLVDQPTRTYASLENLVYGLLQHSRPILIPFGPKIFSLCCLLVATVYAPEVTVWRVSGASLARPGDRKASGKVISMRVRFVRN